MPLISKIFEKKLFINRLNFFLKIFYHQNSVNLEKPILNSLKNWLKCLDKSGVAGNVLIDLRKAYNFLPHDLLLAKLSAYGFDESAITLIASYQHVKIGSTFSSYLEILGGAPQGSILGLILFNVFINDFIFFIQETEVSNFADDTTLYSCSPNFEESTLKLSNGTHLILNRFRINSMVENPTKFQIMFLGPNIDSSKIKFMIEKESKVQK